MRGQEQYRWKLSRQMPGPGARTLSLVMYFRSKEAVARHLHCHVSTVTNWLKGKYANPMLTEVWTLEETALPIERQPDPVVLRAITAN
jgi:hypothetical protein